MATIPETPRADPRVDLILRDAARRFDAPVALVPPGQPAPPRTYANARITSAAGEELGYLSILGPPRSGAGLHASLGQLDLLAASLADALSAEPASPPTASAPPTQRRAGG